MSHKSTKNIRTAFFLNLSFSVFELIGGIYVNSVSIISDAIHDFGDALSIATAWVLDKKSESKPDKKYTYGYLRFSVLGALINSVILLIGSIVMLYNAIPRIINPEPIDYNGILLLAIVGLLVNGFGAYKTASGNAISQKVVSLHLIEDVLGWLAILIGSIFMKFFDVPVIDPILSIAIVLFILFNVFKNLKKIFAIFLERAPKNIDTDIICKEILKNEHISDIHHVHLWSIDGINNYLTAHVVVKDDILKNNIIEIKQYIRDKFLEHNIQHPTIEIEFENEVCNAHECKIDKHEIHIGHHHH